MFGIRLAVHFSFLLLLAYVAWEGWMDAGWLGVAWSVAFILLLFTCVVLHELGHSLTARRFGIGVPRILLLPIGGMAEFDSIPRQPRRELLITLAGPAVNFVIALVLWPFVTMPASWADGDVPLTFAGLGWQLLLVNLVMGGFNLLPVFPMDGGRILRALLALRWPYLKATFWAASLGKVLAVFGATFMILELHNYLGALLFSFIFVAGDIEYRAVRRREEENVQWELLIRRLYGKPDGDGRPAPVNILHGPN
ncbi:MAG: site-2 protease family protein [Opitutaceae bacterium]|nr:site-2 protease family protein [Opitutaceae bacterium]